MTTTDDGRWPQPATPGGDDGAGGHEHPEDLVEHANPVVFWVLTAVGAGILGFGIYGIWTNANTGILGVPLRPWLTWFIGALLLHDLVIAPAALAIGRGLRRVRPMYARAPLQVGIAVTVLVAVLSFPLIRGYGANNQPGNPSVLPKDYETGVVVLLAVVWLTLAAWAWWRRRRASTA